MRPLADALDDLRRGLGLPETAPPPLSMAQLDRLARLPVDALGGVEAYRALLPQLFAAAATPASATALGLEWVKLVQVLDAAGVDSWGQAENEALALFFVELWMGICTGGLPAWQAHDALFAATRFAPSQAQALLAELSHRPGAPARRALLAELGLKGERLAAPWVQNRAGEAWTHPAEAPVRIWLCDPWRGVELAQELAGYRGADGNAFRRRLERWRQLVKA